MQIYINMLYLLFTLNLRFAQVIEKPSNVRVSLYEPKGLFIQWRTVKDFQINPIVGYKIRLWQVDEDNHISFTLLNDEILSVVSDERTVELYSPKPSEKPPQEYKMPQTNIQNDFSIKIRDGVQYNTVYDVRVLAYRKDEDGPMSDPIIVKIVEGDGYKVLTRRTSRNNCEVTVASDQIPENGESYYHLETVYM